MFAPTYDYVEEAKDEAELEAKIEDRIKKEEAAIKIIRFWKLYKSIEEQKIKNKNKLIIYKNFFNALGGKRNRNIVYNYINYLKKYHGFRFIYKNNYNYWESFYKNKLKTKIEYYNNGVQQNYLKDIFKIKLLNNSIYYNSDKLKKEKNYCEVLFCLEEKLPKFRVCKLHKCVVKSCPFVKHRKIFDYEDETLLSDYKPNLVKYNYIKNNYEKILKYINRKPLNYLEEGFYNIYNDRQTKITYDGGQKTLILPKHFYLEIKRELTFIEPITDFQFFTMNKHNFKTGIRNFDESYFNLETIKDKLKNPLVSLGFIEDKYDKAKQKIKDIINEDDIKVTYDGNKYIVIENKKMTKLPLSDEVLYKFFVDKKDELKTLYKYIVDILFYELNDQIGLELKLFLNYKNVKLPELFGIRTDNFIDKLINVVSSEIKDLDQIRQLITIVFFYLKEDVIKRIDDVKKTFTEKLNELEKLQPIYNICFDLIFDYYKYVGVAIISKYVNIINYNLDYTYTFKYIYYDKNNLKSLKQTINVNNKKFWSRFYVIDKDYNNNSQSITLKNLKNQNYMNLYVGYINNKFMNMNLNNIIILNLSKNNIKNFNLLQFGSLSNLETLDLSFNKLNLFEIVLSKHNNLKYVYCQNNNLKYVKIDRNLDVIKNSSVNNIHFNFENNNISFIKLDSKVTRFKYKKSTRIKKVIIAKFFGEFINETSTYKYNEVKENSEVYVNMYINFNNNNLKFEQLVKLLGTFYTSSYVYGGKVLSKSQLLPVIFTCENNEYITEIDKIFFKGQIEYYLNNVENSAIFKQKEVGKLLNFIRKSEETYNIKDNEKVVPFKNGLFSNFNKSKSLKLNSSKGFNYCIRHMRVALKEQPEFFDIKNNLKFFTLKDIFSNKFDDYYKINIILDYMMKYNRIEEDELERKYKNDVEWYKKYKKQINEFIFTYLN